MIVPKGWEVKRLDELTLFIKDGTHGTHADVENGIPLLSAKDIENGNILLENNPRLISVEDYSQIHKKYAIEEGDILLTVVGTIGRLAIVQTKKTFTLQRSVAIIRASTTTSNIFLYCAMQSEIFFNQLLLRTNASAQGGIYLGELAKCTLPCPQDSAEQQKIATILSTLDRTIKTTQKLIDKEKMVKKGLMADLLTHGIDEQGRIRSPQTHTYVDSPLGVIPEGWEVKPLSHFFKLKSGDTKPIDTSSQGLCGVYGGNGITGYSNYYNNDAITLVIGRVGEYCGCVYKVDKCWITDNALLIDKKILSFDTNYMFFLLIFLNLNQYKSETGQPLLNQTIIGKVIVPYVPKQEQERIATILSAQDRKIETEETNLAKLRNLKKGLMGDLLSGDVRVKG